MSSILLTEYKAHDVLLSLDEGVIRVAAKERSQSEYAAPAPKPVLRAMGHVRPAEHMRTEQAEKRNARLLKRMTDASTPAPKPTPLK